jgi:hypothetical protein
MTTRKIANAGGAAISLITGDCTSNRAPNRENEPEGQATSFTNN